MDLFDSHFLVCLGVSVHGLVLSEIKWNKSGLKQFLKPVHAAH